jgi:hypothetical protein
MPDARLGIGNVGAGIWACDDQVAFDPEQVHAAVRQHPLPPAIRRTGPEDGSGQPGRALAVGLGNLAHITSLPGSTDRTAATVQRASANTVSRRSLLRSGDL